VSNSYRGGVVRIRVTMLRAIAIGVAIAGCHARSPSPPVSDAECCCTYRTEYVIAGDGAEADRYEMPVVTERMAANRCVVEDGGRCEPAISEACSSP